ncbi:MAG: bifunctional phosphoribosyl-AMP cyclohydrolase/phosphoribosyl-ATP diphosphatase HisIE [Actinobacteria bacterium]|nr:bifunctional phosphoribosyl-AMP cyclohydrolase/phosphoribosyl-ATP diphosphatase HisIE [Actinomycetota bacterium]
MPFDVNNLRYNDDGLIPAIVQDADTGEVLMLAYMNREAVEKTLAGGETWFWSRSRKKFWHKGETSGNTQKIKDIYYDCDRDTLLIRVLQKGAACHEGYYSCFHYRIEKDGTAAVVGDRCFDPEEVYGSGEKQEKKIENAVVEGPAILEELFKVIRERKVSPPEGSYTASLFAGGLDGILKKIGEEATEVVIAGKSRDSGSIAAEAADLIYHLLVLLADQGVEAGRVYAELAGRRNRPAK